MKAYSGAILINVNADYNRDIKPKSIIKKMTVYKLIN